MVLYVVLVWCKTDSLSLSFSLSLSPCEDLVDDKLGEWYVQRFVHPPPLINDHKGQGHKLVMRLFAVVTSFSPLRLSLYKEGLLFWTNGAYTVADDKQKVRRSWVVLEALLG